MASGRGLIELLNLMRRQAEAGKAVSKIAPIPEQAKQADLLRGKAVESKVEILGKEVE